MGAHGRGSRRALEQGLVQRPPKMYNCLAHNPVFHERAKHIKVRHHFLRDHVEKGEIEMKFIDTER
jgi:hypothetical protein